MIKGVKVKRVKFKQIADADELRELVEKDFTK